ARHQRAGRGATIRAAGLPGGCSRWLGVRRTGTACGVSVAAPLVAVASPADRTRCAVLACRNRCHSTPHWTACWHESTPPDASASHRLIAKPLRHLCPTCAWADGYHLH